MGILEVGEMLIYKNNILNTVLNNHFNKLTFVLTKHTFLNLLENPVQFYRNHHNL